MARFIDLDAAVSYYEAEGFIVALHRCVCGARQIIAFDPAHQNKLACTRCGRRISGWSAIHSEDFDG